MGKSTAAEYLSNRGEFVIDTDVIARQLVEPGGSALDEISEAFGSPVIGKDGRLDRTALAEVVFNNDERRRALEAILHPRIREAWKDWASKRAVEGATRAVVVIPLLFETGAEKELDLTLCVACSEKSQRDRLRARGWDDQEINRRKAAQRPIREKMDRADRVIWSEAAIHITQLQVARIFEAL